MVSAQYEYTFLPHSLQKIVFSAKFSFILCRLTASFLLNSTIVIYGNLNSRSISDNVKHILSLTLSDISLMQINSFRSLIFTSRKWRITKVIVIDHFNPISIRLDLPTLCINPKNHIFGGLKWSQDIFGQSKKALAHDFDTQKYGLSKSDISIKILSN